MCSLASFIVKSNASLRSSLCHTMWSRNFGIASLWNPAIQTNIHTYIHAYIHTYMHLGPLSLCQARGPQWAKLPGLHVTHPGPQSRCQIHSGNQKTASTRDINGLMCQALTLDTLGPRAPLKHYRSLRCHILYRKPQWANLSGLHIKAPLKPPRSLR